MSIPAFATALALTVPAPLPIISPFEGGAPWGASRSDAREEPPLQLPMPTAASTPSPPVIPTAGTAQAAPVLLSDPRPLGDPVDPNTATQDRERGVDKEAPTTTPDIVVTGRDRRGDPLAKVNEQGYAITQAVDKAVVAPAARAFKVVPRPIRRGLRNFLANLREPVVALNYLLQIKPGKAGETLGRFAVNTTIGAAGLIDVAKKRPFNLPRRQNGLGNTLGFYGVKPGPFLYLPLIGPTTVRDLLGNVADQLIIPLTTVSPFNKPIVTIPLLNLAALDYRNDVDEQIKKIRASPDPYAAARKQYLDSRQAEIDALRGPRRSKPKAAEIAPSSTPVLIPPPTPAPTPVPVPVSIKKADAHEMLGAAGRPWTRFSHPGAPWPVGLGPFQLEASR